MIEPLIHSCSHLTDKLFGFVVMEKYVGHIHVQRQLELSEQTDTTMHMKYLMII